MSDTICAISTALGVGAISIIRISGDEAIAKVTPLFTGKNLNEVASHTIHYGHIVDNNEIIDEVLVSVFKAPKTYTKEDIVEINAHGGIATTKKILEVLLAHGLRLAQEGEFTRRAFLNGRIDLNQAEAVNNLLVANTDLKRKLALNGLSGKVSKKIQNARSLIVDLLANIEVNIDFPEYEDALLITLENIPPALKNIEEVLNDLLAEAKIGTLISDGIKVALIGRPNVGKSSILNHLLNEDKAIVTDIAGTTRDTIEGELILEGVHLKFIDTAGIHATTNTIEQIGVDKSLKALNEADLVIHVLNNNEEYIEDESLTKLLKTKTHITFVNKSDLPSKLTLKEDYILGNTVSEDGLDALKQRIIELFNLDQIKNNNLEVLSSPRAIGLVSQALNHIKNAKKNVSNEIPVDMLAIDIKAAYDVLGEITGESYQDELLDTLFKNFCLGK